jgi:hypothetical protein
MISLFYLGSEEKFCLVSFYTKVRLVVSQTSESDYSKPGRPPLVRLVKGQEVNLGCGALIIIAIIVAVCSGTGRMDLSPVLSRLDKMEQRMQAIEKKLDELNKKPEK